MSLRALSRRHARRGLALLLAAAAAGCAHRPPPAPAAPPAVHTVLGTEPTVASGLARLPAEQRETALRLLVWLAGKQAPVAAKLVERGGTFDEIVAKVKAGDGDDGGDGDEDAPRPAPPARYAKVAVPAWAPVRGPASAPVTVVVFSDFQCPFCKRLVPTLDKIVARYGDEVRIVWRNAPLPFHPRAIPAARLAMAAQLQGRFWQVHDRLFESQPALEDDALDHIAVEAGLDAARLRVDREGAGVADALAADGKDARTAGANGTPTCFVNGRAVVGAQPFGVFRTVIDEELRTAEKVAADGVAPADLYAKIIEKFPASPPPEEGDSEEGPAVVDVKIPAGAPSRGPANAPVTLVEFSDFQCPFCARVEPTLREVEKRYAGKLRLVFMHLPLPFHANAQIAAEAAAAAHQQGRFWEMHDRLFDNQQHLGREDLDGHAAAIGLDVARFKKALDERALGSLIDADVAEAKRIGAGGTPTFFVNGTRIVGAQPLEAFVAAIDKALAAGAPAGAAGAPPSATRKAAPSRKAKAKTK